MLEDRPVRRRSPWWVRQLAQMKVHQLACRLDSLWRSEGVSEQQRWLLDACISELEYRNRRLVPADRCTCRICFSPFDG